MVTLRVIPYCGASFTKNTEILACKIARYMFSTPKDQKIILDLDIQNRQFPYDGSMDYWEQYDLEVVQRNGLAVITSNEDKSLLSDEAFCFLCGSKGK